MSDSENMPPPSPPVLRRQNAVCREIPRLNPIKYPPSNDPPLTDSTPSELAATIERALDYMWRRRTLMDITPEEEKIKIKLEQDVYKMKLDRKRRFSKASIVFSAPRDTKKSRLH